MNAVVILYPSIAMAFLTLGMILWMGFSRFTAIRNRSVSIKYYKTYNQGEQPARLHLIGRHIQNHFEVPPLFHMGVLATYASDSVTTLGVALAWAFFGFRCVHSLIHLGSNNVSARFAAYGSSLFVLTGLWACLLFALL